MNGPLCGVVLCGGGSRRMGRDKSLLRLAGGPPLVLTVAGRLRGVADPVLLASGRPGRLGVTGYSEVADTVGGGGPLGGLIAGLDASPHALAGVVAVDMPFCSPRLLRLLAGLCGDHHAAVPVMPGGDPEPLHAVYSRGALPGLRASLLEGELGLRRALSRLDVRLVPPDEWALVESDGRFATNLNSPADLALWE